MGLEVLPGIIWGLLSHCVPAVPAGTAESRGACAGRALSGSLGQVPCVPAEPDAVSGTPSLLVLLPASSALSQL